MNEPTPRTDAVEVRFTKTTNSGCTCTNTFVSSDFSRTLERELARTETKLESLETSIADLSHPNLRMLLTERDEQCTLKHNCIGELERLRAAFAKANEQIAMDSECILRITRAGMESEIERDACRDALNYMLEWSKAVLAGIEARHWPGDLEMHPEQHVAATKSHPGGETGAA